MKKELIIFLLTLSSLAGTAQDPQYCRPVKEAFGQTLVDVIEDTTGAKIRLFKGEWFETYGKSNANAKIKNEVDCWLKTDGNTKETTILDGDQKGLLSDHKPLDIKCFKTKDSLYIKVPATEDSKWFYVINQTENTLLSTNDSNSFDRWISYPIMRIFRVSPDNHVVSVFKSDDVKETVEVKDTISDDGSSYLRQRIIIGNDTIRDQKLREIENSKTDSESFSKVLFPIFIGLLVLIAVIYAFLIYRKRKANKNKRKEEEKKYIVCDKHQEEKTISRIELKDLNDLVAQLPEEFAHMGDQIKEWHECDVKKRITKIQDDNTQQIAKIIRKSKESEDQLQREFSEKIEKEKKKTIDAEAKYDKLKDSFDEKVKEKVEKIQKDSEKTIQKAEKERDDAIKEKDDISDKLNAQFEKTKKELVEAKVSIQKKYDQTDAELRKTKEYLKKTTDNLNVANKTIKTLEDAQAKFTNVLTYVPFAEDYTKKVMALLNVVDQMNKSATKLLDVETVEDPYHITKSLAKFAKAIADIDMAQFYTDIKMITEGQMVLKDTTIATYDQNLDNEQLHNSLKIYFFDTYLAKYINAAVVLNESCIGLDRLVKGLTKNDVMAFLKYREELEQCVDQLEIEVETTHLFDKVGQKIDLRVTLVNAGFATGDILEIENCFVYLKGGQRPDSKIFVKAQS